MSHRAFRDQLDPHAHVDLDGITLTLARGAAVVLFSLFFLRVQGFLETARWDLLPTAYGAWFLFEVLGFILIPALLFAWATRARKVTFIRALAAWTVLGVVVNRINVSMIAMNWTRSELHAQLDRDHGLDHHHHHRRSDVPLDRQPDARAARSTGLPGALGVQTR